MKSSLPAFLVFTSSILFAHGLGRPPSPIGSIGVMNNCDFPVYMEITRERVSPLKVLEPGETYQEKYHFPAYGGTSMKVAQYAQSLLKGEKEVQLEYSCSDKCYVDFSMINNSDKFPGKDSTLVLRPSDPGCDTLICTAGDTICKDAYFKPSDNQAVRACSLQADWALTLCARPGAQQTNSQASKDPVSRSSTRM